MRRQANRLLLGMTTDVGRLVARLLLRLLLGRRQGLLGLCGLWGGAACLVLMEGANCAAEVLREHHCTVPHPAGQREARALQCVGWLLGAGNVGAASMLLCALRCVLMQCAHGRRAATVTATELNSR